MRMRVHLLVLLAIPLYAQPVSVGVKVGVPFADPAGRYGESRPYTLGPVVELRLPAGFAVEGSAMYRRLGTTTIFNYPAGYFGQAPDGDSTVVTRIRGNAWDFSLLPKYYFGGRNARWQPFLGTGWTLRTVDWNYQGSVTTTVAGSTTVSNFNSSSRSDLGVGATVAAGVRLRTNRISWIPEIRYTRWGNQNSGPAPGRRNEGAVYLGIRF
jgi:hypothetical protein